jgi:hypothetical protein
MPRAVKFAEGMTAMMIIFAMSLGLIVPKLIIDYLGDRSIQRS